MQNFPWFKYNLQQLDFCFQSRLWSVFYIHLPVTYLHGCFMGVTNCIGLKSTHNLTTNLLLQLCLSSYHSNFIKWLYIILHNCTSQKIETHMWFPSLFINFTAFYMPDTVVGNGVIVMTKTKLLSSWRMCGALKIGGGR